MDAKLKQSLISDTKKGKLFDWLASKGWQLDSDDLLVIAKEAAFAHSDKSSFATLAEELSERL